MASLYNGEITNPGVAVPCRQTALLESYLSEIERHLELESLGVLRQTKVPAELTWMTEPEKRLILSILLAGEHGLHKAAVLKMEAKSPDMLFNVTIRSLAEWVTDKAGRPAALVLTWQGEEVARLLHQVAKHESRKLALNTAK